mmetsp:Transcript_25666/g.36809  ORF Transcript_25666/g.36809 Transcript_25666/m.36809 type:complete len:316 (-) Transcript_25666:225-1172(-)
MAGRRYKNIHEEEVSNMLKLGFTFDYISNYLSISRKTLYRWIRRTEFCPPFTFLNNEELDNVILQHITGEPRRGENSIAAYLQSNGYKVSRAQLRESIHRVDPEGVLERSRKPIHRRAYNVLGPHHLWHIDGNHKLIRYGMVIHGCIDGRTRCIIYLALKNSNSSKVVLDLFKDGVNRFQLPDRVRGDRGGENVLVCDYMIEKRGLNRSSFIAGSSKHNNRIERLWRDMRRHSTQFYIDLFRSLEDDGMDLDNLLHIYTLQYLFMQRINESLLQFINVWNNHKLRTEHSFTTINNLQSFISEFNHYHYYKMTPMI